MTQNDPEQLALDKELGKADWGNGLFVLGWIIAGMSVITCTWIWTGWRAGTWFWFWWTLGLDGIGLSLVAAGLLMSARCDRTILAITRNMRVRFNAERKSRGDHHA